MRHALRRGQFAGFVLQHEIGQRDADLRDENREKRPCQRAVPVKEAEGQEHDGVHAVAQPVQPHFVGGPRLPCQFFGDFVMIDEVEDAHHALYGQQDQDQFHGSASFAAKHARLVKGFAQHAVRH